MLVTTLSVDDVDRAAQLVQQANSPHLSPDDQRRLQQDVFEMQRRPEAWGLIVPFMQHPDPYVQFFGAHTAQVKISRDWDTYPRENAPQLRLTLLELTGGTILRGSDGFIVRKLYVAITALALRIASLPPSDDSHWTNWVLETVAALSAHGTSSGYALEFLAIASEEVQRADLLGPSKSRMQETLLDALPMVVAAVTTAIDAALAQRQQPVLAPSSVSKELAVALKCLEGWLSVLRSNDLTPMIPSIIRLLDPVSVLPDGTANFDETTFVAASDALQEIMSSSPLANGAGGRTLTEPLLLWLDTWGGKIVQETLGDGSADAISHSLCKLLVGLGDHSTDYLATNLASSAPVVVVPPLQKGASLSAPPTRGALVQAFLRLLLSYTSLPGYYGVDEEESEMTLGFWYLFQEALWNIDADDEESLQEAGRQASRGLEKKEQEQWVVAKALYAEAVKVLRRKIVWPNEQELAGWTRDAKDKFKVYRRDVGDALINAYYILRDDMLGYYVNDIAERLASRHDTSPWEDLEATLHCIMSIQEAVPLESNPHLPRIFSPEVLGRLPRTGHDRIRLTTIGLLGEYASWFTTDSSDPGPQSLLMNAVGYVVVALAEPQLCLPAANALRDLCDANRIALAPHISAFAELHAGLNSIPDTEKSKVLQSIASVVQALPPEEGIPPIQSLVDPVVMKLVEALRPSSQSLDDARTSTIQQLQTLGGIAKGLTRASDPLFLLDDPPAGGEEADRMARARNDPRMARLRDAILEAVTHAFDVWSADASVSDALSDFIRAITSLPSDVTLLSQSPGPILQRVCVAAGRHLTAVWLSLASMLIVQMDPPSLFPLALKTGPNLEARALLLNVLPNLLQSSLAMLSQPGAMEGNPDIVQAFFGCMDAVAQHYIEIFYQLPEGALSALLGCSVSSLALQERYSLVSACTFLGSLITYTSKNDATSEMKSVLIEPYGRNVMRAILCGFAGVAPRSATPNLVELLATLLAQYPNESRRWISEILFADDFVESKADRDAKETFAKALSGPRSVKRMRDAAQQFTVIARGLEGSSFGFTSVTV